MQLIHKIRHWHRWASPFIALPILIIALTTVLIAHRKALGTEDITVPASWLPGYQAVAGKPAIAEARTSLKATDGTRYVGTLGGLFRLQGEQLVAVEELAGTQLRGLAEAPWGRIAAARNGVWLEAGHGWQRVLKGDAWNASARADGSIVVSLRDKGLLVSRDGKQWQADPELTPALAALASQAASEPITLSRLAMDLHTGRAFFGRDGEWIWIDLLGLSLGFLSLTGLTLWLRSRRRKPRPQGLPENKQAQPAEASV